MKLLGLEIERKVLFIGLASFATGWVLRSMLANIEVNAVFIEVLNNER